MDRGGGDAGSPGGSMEARLATIREHVDACRSALRSVTGRQLNDLLALLGPLSGGVARDTAPHSRDPIRRLATATSNELDEVADALEKVVGLLDEALREGASGAPWIRNVEPTFRLSAPLSAAVAAVAPSAAVPLDSRLQQLSARLEAGKVILKEDDGLDAQEACEPVDRCQQALQKSLQLAAGSADSQSHRSIEQAAYLHAFNEISCLRFDDEAGPGRWRDDTLEFILGVLANEPFRAVLYDRKYPDSPIVPGRTHIEELLPRCFLSPAYEQAALPEATVLRVVRHCFVRPGRGPQDEPEVVQQGKLVASDGSLHV